MDEKFNYYGRQSEAGNNDSLDRENTWGQTEQNPENENGSSSLYSYSYINKEGDAPCVSGETEKKSERKKKNKEGRKQGRKSFKTSLAQCAALALVFGLVAGGCFSGIVYATGAAQKGKSAVSYGNNEGSLVSTTSTNNSGKNLTEDVSGIVKEVMPSIVAITNVSEVEVPNFFGTSQTYEQPRCGSGIIIGQDDEQILLVTNNHVVAGAKTLTVSFVDNTTATAQVKGTDPGSDLAVLSVNLKELTEDTRSQIKVAVMGKSEELQVGGPAIAIGNALGYGQTVTTGVISALDRDVTVENVTNSLIQTDAAINPGNSGGALLNLKGEVIGINSVKYADRDVEGIGFAIPISTAEPIIEDLINRKAVDKKDQAYLGIYGVDVSDEVSQVYQMPVGVYITQVVEGGAAEKAGLHSGDIIVKFDGKKVTSMEELQRLLPYYAAGKKVDVVVKVSENGKYQEKTINVKLDSASDAKQ